MSNKLYRYKQLSGKLNGKHIKSWPKPITVIRKRGDLTCEGCYFANTHHQQTTDRCAYMLQSGQLPTCYPNYIFNRVITTYYEKRQIQRSYEKLQKKLNKDNTQKLKIA
jgi:hypothetical protein